MRNLKVRTKMILIVGLSVVNMFIIILMALFAITALDKISTNKLRESIMEDYDQRIKEQVENASSMVDGVMAMADNGDATREEALEYAARALRDIRYGEDGYFWADTIEGTNVVLLGSDTEGTMRLHAKDADGFEFVSAIINAAKRGGGYVDYKFAKENGTTPLPKRAYSLLNEKTGWVIGTGNYVDDMEVAIQEEIQYMQKRIMAVGMLLFETSLFLAVLTFVLARGISKSILSALRTSFSYIESMAGGDFTTEISKEMLERKDDFGKLAEELEFLKDSIGKLIKDIKVMAETVEENNDEVDAGFAKVRSDTDDVCQNIENLSAIFAETAASMDQFTEFALNVGKYTAGLYDKTNDAVEKIFELHRKIDIDRNKAFGKNNMSPEGDEKSMADQKEFLEESMEYENYVDEALADIEHTSAELREDMESLMASIGQISDVSGQGSIGVDSIEDSILAIREKIAELEDAFKNTEEMVFELDYEVAKYAVRDK